MAYTKIHAIKATLPKAIKYILNPDKTDGQTLISTFACGTETAAFDFQYALSKTKESDPNKAFHLIQSFFPGEVSYEEAHKVGVELADKVLEGKYSYVVSTHIDKGHIHNHIIFCAADNIDHKKYNDCKKSYWRIRNLSDELCTEHGLSVISPSNERGKTYKEWLSGKQNVSWKTTLKRHIDEAIKTAETYEDCIALIRAKGYEINGETFGDNTLKYISFRPLNQEHFVRGSAKSLGNEYTKERIKARLEEMAVAREKSRSAPDRHAAFPKKKKTIVQNHSNRTLIDTTTEKFAESPGLKHWADIQNLKIAAANYSETGSISKLEKQIAAKSELAKTARQSLVETEHRLKDFGQILKYAEQYKSNRIYHVRYQKSKDKDRYLRQHETELLLHDGAENMLKRFGINSKNLNIEKLRNDYNALCQKKAALQQTYKSAGNEIATLNRKLDNLNRYLERMPETSVADKKTDKIIHSL
ncbi:MAG: relaxase/mobilization nuclease domain-containing protein [Eubacterium sp.]|nr:relaxase/mobilization nuclease domain-containing protein [Eubacterium sp.]